jgi:3D (Asp-Asp-Asp) domain-containing protein
MSGEYFAEFKTGVNNAWKVELGNWIAFSGVPPVVLAGSIPTVPFRVAIITEAITSHSDVAGIVKVNDEELTFTRATRLTAEEELTVWPTITLTGLDCKITVELISVDGEYLQNETLVPMEIICFPKTRILRDRSGSGWQQTNYDIWSEEPLNIGDQIRFFDPHQNGQTIDIYVKNVDSAVDLEFGNTQPFRVYNCA